MKKREFNRAFFCLDNLKRRRIEWKYHPLSFGSLSDLS